MKLISHRDVVKKKREEQLKMVWRMSPVHKRLQTRMEHMRRFRYQHEQLRTVIVRVLRPNVVATSTRGPEADQILNSGSSEQQDDTSFDSADSSAIEVLRFKTVISLCEIEAIICLLF